MHISSGYFPLLHCQSACHILAEGDSALQVLLSVGQDGLLRMRLIGSDSADTEK